MLHDGKDGISQSGVEAKGRDRSKNAAVKQDKRLKRKLEEVSDEEDESPQFGTPKVRVA